MIATVMPEGVLIGIAEAKNKDAGERALLVAILLVVGLHFLPMAVGFGLCSAINPYGYDF